MYCWAIFQNHPWIIGKRFYLNFKFVKPILFINDGNIGNIEWYSDTAIVLFGDIIKQYSSQSVTSILPISWSRSSRYWTAKPFTALQASSSYSWGCILPLYNLRVCKFQKCFHCWVISRNYQMNLYLVLLLLALSKWILTKSRWPPKECPTIKMLAVSCQYMLPSMHIVMRTIGFEYIFWPGWIWLLSSVPRWDPWCCTWELH